jgi:hypothetical protein
MEIVSVFSIGIALRALPMVYLKWFLSLLIDLTKQKFNLTALLMKKENKIIRNHFLMEKPPPHVDQCTKKMQNHHWEETSSFYMLRASCRTNGRLR